MTLKDILISGKLTISEGGGGGGISVDDIADKSLAGSLDLQTTTIGDYAFYDFDDITTVKAPNLTTIGTAAFFSCAGLTTINFPEVTTLNAQAFSYAGNEANPITIIVLPKLSTLTGRSHFDRGWFEAIDLGPNLATLSADCIYHNTGRKICNNLILRRTEGVVTASTWGSIFGARGTIWVPSALIESYKVATNWDERYNAGDLTFAAIEGSIYENAYADGTPIA